MFFGLAIVLMYVGLLFMAIPSLIPIPVPMEFRIITYFMGIVLPTAGMLILMARADKTMASKLIAPGHPQRPLWFYIYKAGDVRIVNSVRQGDNYLFSDELDSLIPDVKSYSLADHKVRFVPEGAAHAVDLEMAEYMQLLSKEKGFKGLRHARNAALKLVKPRETKGKSEMNAIIKANPQLRKKGGFNG